MDSAARPFLVKDYLSEKENTDISVDAKDSIPTVSKYRGCLGWLCYRQVVVHVVLFILYSVSYSFLIRNTANPLEINCESRKDSSRDYSGD